jgi:hypothetical protein
MPAPKNGRRTVRRQKANPMTAPSPTVFNNASNGHNDLDVQVASLAAKVLNLDDGQRNIIASLTALNVKMDAKAGTNWGVIGTFCGVFVAGAAVLLTVISLVGSIVYSQIRSDSERLASAMVKMDDRFMPASQIDHEFSVRASKRDDWEKNATASIADDKRLIEKLQDNVVPRGEHVQHWEAEKTSQADSQRQIDDLRGRMNDLYSAKDFMRDLNERTKMLEAQIRGK